MSSVRSIYRMCDGCGEAGPAAATDKSAYEEVKALGWRQAGGYDICLQCVTRATMNGKVEAHV